MKEIKERHRARKPNSTVGFIGTGIGPIAMSLSSSGIEIKDSVSKIYGIANQWLISDITS